jgi:hypothetical protein
VIFIVGLLLMWLAKKAKGPGHCCTGPVAEPLRTLGRRSGDGWRPGQGEVVERGAHAQSALAAGRAGNGGHAFLRVEGGSSGVTVKARRLFSTACADDKRVIILRK